MFKIREDNITNTAMEAMLNDMQYQEEPLIGSFWYDQNRKELFGVDQVPVSTRKFFYSAQFGHNIRTGPILHQTRWKREVARGKDERFKGDYTLVPRGRVFELEDNGFAVYTGKWINEMPEAKDEIITDFQLPRDKTIFIEDEHWNIGHGWSEEEML